MKRMQTLNELNDAEHADMNNNCFRADCAKKETTESGQQQEESGSEKEEAFKQMIGLDDLDPNTLAII